MVTPRMTGAKDIIFILEINKKGLIGGWGKAGNYCSITIRFALKATDIPAVFITNINIERRAGQIGHSKINSSSPAI